MYYFIKKTNELVKQVKENKIPPHKISQLQQNAMFVRVLFGFRKDKSFFIYNNQCRKVMPTDELTNIEIETLKYAYSHTYNMPHDTKNNIWTKVCSIIKASRNGNYPPNWYNVLKRENMVNEHFNIEFTNNNYQGQGAEQKAELSPTEYTDDIFLNSVISNMLNTISIKEKNKSPIIVIDMIGDTDTKKNVMNKNKNQSDIYLCYEVNGIKKSIINFITRINIDTIKFIDDLQTHHDNHFPFAKQMDKVLPNDIDPNIKTGNEILFEFGYPYENLKLPCTDDISSKKKLFLWILQKCNEFNSHLNNEYILDDIGIKSISKVESNYYKINFII